MIKIVKGDLLESDCKYIAHQCNCITTSSAGLASDIFKKYPYSDVYKLRFGHQNERGTLDIKGNGLDKRFIINMFVQWYPGGPQKGDSLEDRLFYFEQCLDLISKISNLESIGFPYGIGCGLAKGSWDLYYNEIVNFSNKLTNTCVKIYKNN